LPNSILISLIFINWTQGQDATLAALPILPIAIAARTLFLTIIAHFIETGLLTALTIATISWAAISAPFAFLNTKNIFGSAIIAALILTIPIFYFKKYGHKPPVTHNKKLQVFATRFVLSGILVAAAVLTSKLIDPIWGGFVAGFPAAFAASALLITPEHGTNYFKSIAKSMITGSVANILFTMGAFLLIPKIGAYAAIGISFILTAAIAFKTSSLKNNQNFKKSEGFKI